MTSGADDPEVPRLPVQDTKPSLLAGLGSIAAGAVGFCVPVLGLVASCAGIWLGVAAIRRGRAARDRTNVVCGIGGVTLSGLGIVVWVAAVLFESYR